MKIHRGFASDNASGVHPRVLAALADANTDHVLPYGDDPWTARAIDALRSAFDSDAEVLLCFGGTGANVIGLASVTRPHEAVLCADSAHIWTSEGGAPERFLGGKLVPLPAHQGKLEPATVRTALKPGRGVHQVRPRTLSITQPTEWGTLYRADEIRALAELVHAHDMVLHVDGARFANAAAASAASLADCAPRLGVDVLSFGGTKNGLLGAEAVLLFDRALAVDAAWQRKQATQLASKMRFLAAQFIAYLEHDLWRELAGHANAMAARLATALDGVAGVEFVCPVETNQLFPRLPPAALAALQADWSFYAWDEAQSIARWITSFDTRAEEIDAFAAEVRRAVAT
ncbi:MAG: threonine aldolase [Gammaproteobacteria bacterium]|nr:threonine aldolase [Gammaproteobacteria bacterium]